MKAARILISASLVALLLDPSLRAEDPFEFGPPVPAELENGFSPISDVDLIFLISQPKLPWKADPFVRKPGYAETAKAEERFTLSGIAWNPREPMAIINGKAVVQGGQVGTRTVAAIGRNYVILEKEDSRIEIALPGTRAGAEVKENR